MNEDLWARSRGGSHAGRGFHYQDAVATELALRAWRGEIAVRRLVPEGLEDVSLQLDTHWLHVQAKSRRQHRGAFTFDELTPAWCHLAKRLAVDAAAHAALVLERPLGSAETGLERVLADVAKGKVKKAIASAVGDIVEPADFLARTHVLVMPAAMTTGVQLLADELEIAAATCVAHYEILGAELARLADENGIRNAGDPAAVTVGEIARIIDDVSEAVDASALEEAVRAGVCELVDFATPIDDERFYSGVDVVVGHVVAGLPLARPTLSDALRGGLLERRVALAVGPSGGGKSALIWLTAYETRHLVRWYRVSKLRADDVRPLVRLVKGLAPTGATVGFAVDDVGRDDRIGFDKLVEELRGYPGTLILGACREEDLFVVRTAPQAAQVRPTLEEELAERIWRELRAGEETVWQEWREPYELSERLLLEYGHLLTEGTRLEETVAAQVARRVAEQRELELAVLALVATADAFGAELDATRLAAALGVDTTVMKGALVRLVDEHLIRDHDGALGGLHELRSRYVMGEIHDLPPPTLAETVRHVIELLDGTALQPFLTRLLLEEAVPDEVAIEAVAARLALEPDPRALAAALHALRLVGLKRGAVEWREVVVAEGASPSDVGLISFLALQAGGADMFPEPIQRAVARIRAIDPVDLRAPLLAKVKPQIANSLAAAGDIATAATVLAALGEVGAGVAIEVAPLARLAEGASLEELRLLLEAAYAAAPELAVDLAEAIGGSGTLLQRLEEEQPWVRDAHLGAHDGGRSSAAAEYAYVAESAQPPAHGAVVELTRYLMALAPSAEVAVCRAVDATGETAGFGGVPLAEKAIPRENLPSRAEVAWNRARGRAAIAAVAAQTATEHTRASRDIVARTARLVRRAGGTWVRGRRPTQALVGEAIALAEAARALKPPPLAVETAGPLDEGELPLADPANFVGVMVANNLFPNLFKGNSVAPLIPQIVEKVGELAEPDYWRLLADPPLADVSALREALLDLHAVVAEKGRPDRIGAVALQAAGKNGLASAARVARQRGGKRMQAVADELERKLAESGFSTRVLRREGEPDSHGWPSDDFLVLVDAGSITEWQRNLEKLADLCRPLLDDRIGFLIAPIREGRVVSSYGAKVLTNVFPDESVRDWPDLPLPLVDERVAGECRRGLGSLAEVSGVLASVRRSEVHDDEGAVVEAAMGRANETLRFFNDLAEEMKDPLIVEVGGTLLELAHRVEEEAEALAQGTPVARSIAASVIYGLNGDVDDVFGAYVGAVSACVEWDVDPDGAWSRFQQALDSDP